MEEKTNDACKIRSCFCHSALDRDPPTAAAPPHLRSFGFEIHEAPRLLTPTASLLLLHRLFASLISAKGGPAASV